MLVEVLGISESLIYKEIAASKKLVWEKEGGMVRALTSLTSTRSF
jgi:hypothetical protein